MHIKTSTLNLNWPSLLVLVRHGESEGNKYGRHHMAQVVKKPAHAYALTRLGISQAKQAGQFLHERYQLNTFDAYFASTYKRAQETFKHIFKNRRKDGHLITPIIDARVNEINRGYASLYSADGFQEKYPHDVEVYKLNGWYHNIPLSGQSCVELEYAIHSFLAFLRETCADKKVIVVGHGIWINLCTRILMNKPIEEAERRQTEDPFINCSATIFEKNPKTGHLELVGENVKTWK